MTRKALMIVPSLPPERGGLGDYALCLVRALQAASAPGREPLSWTFLSARGAAESDALLRPEGLAVEALPDGEAALDEALRRIAPNVLALQYVGYGYARGGAPLALAGTLSRWRQGDAERRLVVMFHEIWAAGPPWTRAFWSHRAQRKAAATLARAADASLVSTRAAQRLLEERTGCVAEVAPIPSNIVAPPGHAPRRGGDGALRVVVFGLQSTRMDSLRRFAPLLRALHDAGRLGALVLMGSGLTPGDAATPEARFLALFAPGARLENAGEGSAEEISRQLAAADLALSPTPAHLVTKSGASMAALAHGVPLVLPAGWEPCPLTRGSELFVLDGDAAAARELVEGLTMGALEEVGAGGRRWYEEHASWPVQVERWHKALGFSSF